MFENSMEKLISNTVRKYKPLNIHFRNYSNRILFTFILFIFSFTVNATVYYVSNSGNDSNSGTSTDKPWKTISKVNSYTFKPGDQILFKRGDQWTGTVTVSAAGTSGSPIVYGAYGTGSKPKIYGSEIITGWTKHSGNIYKASFNGNINQLFLDENKMKAARHPNSGYIFITSTSGSTSLTANDLDGSKNYAGAKWFGRTNYFTASLIDVKSSSSKTLNLNSAPRFPLKAGLGFFLMNKLDFLDQAGEWFYDQSSKTVYLWTANGDSPSNYTIRGSVHKDGFYLSGKHYVTIRDIQLLQQSEKGVHLRNSNHVVISGNDFSDADGFGIFCETESNNISILNNSITGVNHYGMFVRISHSIIADNNLTKIALFDNIGLTGTGQDNFGGGIYLAGENGNNKVRYNRLTEIGYSGILFGRPKNIIEYNFVKDVCLLKSDMGGIYTSWFNRKVPIGPEGSIIKNNIVLNVKGEKYGYTSTRHLGEGIYVDESAKGVTVENNTIAHVTNSGIKLHKNENATVRNNTILDARQSIHVLHSSGTLKNKIHNNIMMAASDKDDYLQRQVLINESARNAISDYNQYVNPYASEGIFRSGSSYYNFNGWKSATGQEKNSTVNVKPFANGEKEQLFYNDTKQDKTINLGSKTFKDLDGNNVTGSFVLKPFTSRILIGNSSGTISQNQNPVISDQDFEITAAKEINEFIGQITASDPDAGQTLRYTIVSGNSEGLFAIDATTGELTANKAINVSANKTVVLEVEVKDNDTNPLSARGKITIYIKAQSSVSDIIAPSITLFTIPATSGSLTVPVSLQGNDNTGVTGWRLSESSIKPSSADPGWNSAVPSEYTFSEGGTKTLYAWAKDASGNVSGSLSRTVIITLTGDDGSPENTEYVTICEGENYLGWTETGIYERIINENKAVQSGGTNLISNGDFNSGITGWNVWGASGYGMAVSADTKDFISAPGSIKLGCESTGTSASSLQFISNTNFQVEAGKVYELSFYAKATTDFELQKVVIIQRSTPYAHYGSFESVNPGISKEWKQIKLRFTASQSATDASFRMYLGNSLPAGHSVYFDDIVFSELSEETISTEQVVTTHLTVSSAKYSSEDIEIIEGENYNGWTVAGVYSRTLVSAGGCDSIVTTNLKVGAISSDPEEEVVTEYVTICEGENYNGWTESGVYERLSPGQNGANILIVTHLTVDEPVHVTETIKIWDYENYNGWNVAGHYERVLHSASGCDSIVTTKLVVRGKIYENSNDTMSQPISGKEEKRNELTSASAFDSGNSFILYPNPAQSFINVEYREFPDNDTRIEIIDISGRTVYQQEVGAHTSRIEFDQLSPGMYYLRSVNKRSQQVEKFIIE